MVIKKFRDPVLFRPSSVRRARETRRANEVENQKIDLYNRVITQNLTPSYFTPDQFRSLPPDVQKNTYLNEYNRLLNTKPRSYKATKQYLKELTEARARLGLKGNVKYDSRRGEAYVSSTTITGVGSGFKTFTYLKSGKVSTGTVSTTVDGKRVALPTGKSITITPKAQYVDRFGVVRKEGQTGFKREDFALAQARGVVSTTSGKLTLKGVSASKIPSISKPSQGMDISKPVFTIGTALSLLGKKVINEGNVKYDTNSKGQVIGVSDPFSKQSYALSTPISLSKAKTLFKEKQLEKEFLKLEETKRFVSDKAEQELAKKQQPRLDRLSRKFDKISKTIETNEKWRDTFKSYSGRVSDAFITYITAGGLRKSPTSAKNWIYSAGRELSALPYDFTIGLTRLVPTATQQVIFQIDALGMRGYASEIKNQLILENAPLSVIKSFNPVTPEGFANIVSILAMTKFSQSVGKSSKSVKTVPAKTSKFKIGTILKSKDGSIGIVSKGGRVVRYDGRAVRGILRANKKGAKLRAKKTEVARAVKKAEARVVKGTDTLNDIATLIAKGKKQTAKQLSSEVNRISKLYDLTRSQKAEFSKIYTKFRKNPSGSNFNKLKSFETKVGVSELSKRITIKKTNLGKKIDRITPKISKLDKKILSQQKASKTRALSQKQKVSQSQLLKVQAKFRKQARSLGASSKDLIKVNKLSKDILLGKKGAKVKLEKTLNNLRNKQKLTQVSKSIAKRDLLARREGFTSTNQKLLYDRVWTEYKAGVRVSKNQKILSSIEKQLAKSKLNASKLASKRQQALRSQVLADAKKLLREGRIKIKDKKYVVKKAKQKLTDKQRTALAIQVSQRLKKLELDKFDRQAKEVIKEVLKSNSIEVLDPRLLRALKKLINKEYFTLLKNEKWLKIQTGQFKGRLPKTSIGKAQRKALVEKARIQTREARLLRKKSKRAGASSKQARKIFRKRALDKERSFQIEAKRQLKEFKKEINIAKIREQRIQQSIRRSEKVNKLKLPRKTGLPKSKRKEFIAEAKRIQDKINKAKIRENQLELQIKKSEKMFRLNRRPKTSIGKAQRKLFLERLEAEKVKLRLASQDASKRQSQLTSSLRRSEKIFRLKMKPKTSIGKDLRKKFRKEAFRVKTTEELMKEYPLTRNQKIVYQKIRAKYKQNPSQSNLNKITSFENRIKSRFGRITRKKEKRQFVGERRGRKEFRKSIKRKIAEEKDTLRRFTDGDPELISKYTLEYSSQRNGFILKPKVGVTQRIELAKNLVQQKKIPKSKFSIKNDGTIVLQKTKGTIKVTDSPSISALDKIGITKSELRRLWGDIEKELRRRKVKIKTPPKLPPKKVPIGTKKTPPKGGKLRTTTTTVKPKGKFKFINPVSVATGIVLGSKVIGKLKVKVKSLQEVGSIVTQTQLSSQVQALESIQDTAQKVKQDVQVLQKSKLTSVQASALRSELRQLNEIITKTIKRTKIVERKKKIPRLMDLDRLSWDKTPPKGYSYIVNPIVRIKGRNVTLRWKTTPNRAKKRMANLIDNTTSRSFALKIVGLRKVKDIRGDYLKKFRAKISRGSAVLPVVEKTKYAIDTKGEKNQLKLSQLLSRRKKVKVINRRPPKKSNGKTRAKKRRKTRR